MMQASVDGPGDERRDPDADAYGDSTTSDSSSMWSRAREDADHRVLQDDHGDAVDDDGDAPPLRRHAVQVGEHDRQGDPDLPERVERQQGDEAERQHAPVAQHLAVAAERGRRRTPPATVGGRVSRMQRRAR